MVKAIGKTLFLTVLTLVIFLVLLGILGTKGVLVNRELEKKYLANEERIALLDVKKASLEQYRSTLSDKDVLDDMALKLGYNKDGEEVYFFPEREENPVKSVQQKQMVTENADDAGFQGLESYVIGLISLGIVFIPLLLAKLVRLLAGIGRRRSLGDEGRGNYDDYSF
jgi:Septum formation initiator.